MISHWKIEQNICSRDEIGVHFLGQNPKYNMLWMDWNQHVAVL